MSKGVTIAVYETGKPPRYPLEEACRAALAYLTNATTNEFRDGTDRPIRRQLCEALGIDWAEYDRGNVDVTP
jgi:hypothetical protein